jgi:hypothetical protein
VAAETTTAGSAPGGVGGAARDAAHSTALRRLAQVGLLGYALLHLLVAWLVLQVAWPDAGSSGSGSRSADQSGALTLIGRSPAGGALLWALAVGLGGLCVWQAVEVLRHYRRLPSPGRERRTALLQAGKTLATAVFYGYLAVSAVRTALGDGQGRGKEQHTVGGVLGWPGGQVLVVAVAVVTAGIGVYIAVKGLRSGFVEEIDLDAFSPAVRVLTHRFSQVGFVLKGLALVLSGVVVGWAAVGFDPQRADGLDGAVRTVADTTVGPWVLTVIAAGFAAFAVYCLARARHPVG